ncbi:Uncharacterised protein [uncultured archaeon]|nr:Uncharacterised protein [uncultured archaeon]
MELSFIQAYAITIAAETALLFMLLRKDYTPGLVARNALAASTLTLPFVWFVFPLLRASYAVQIGASEIFAVLVEAGVYFVLFPKMKMERAAVLSFVCNAFSFLLGLAVLFYF